MSDDGAGGGGLLRRLDRSAVALALPVGPFLVVVGYLVVLQSSVVIGDPLLLGLAVWPTVAALLVALVLPGHRRWWLSAAAGSAAGTVLAVAVIAGLISGLAYLLSDPGGAPA